MNNTKTLAVVAVLMAATLVVGTFATVATTQSAFAYAKKPRQDDNKKTRDNGSGNQNGNTVTALKCQNKGSASGFDTAVDQECENLICTHPGENATCVQEGAATTTTPKPTTTSLLVKKVCLVFNQPGRPCNPLGFSIQITGNNPQPSTFTLTPDSSQLVTLSPGTFTIVETASFTIINPTFSGDCMQTAPGSTEATGIISVGQHLTCTITNTIIMD
jgi:hypothetical protein